MYNSDGTSALPRSKREPLLAKTNASITQMFTQADPTLDARLGRTPTMDEMISDWRRTVKLSTDWAACEADPLGDGDQSYVELTGANGVGLSKAGSSLSNFWSDGEIMGVLLSPAPEQLKDAIAPRFVRDCIEGRRDRVRAALRSARAEGADALRDLVRRRHTDLRMPPLSWVIAGSRGVGKGHLPPGADLSADHLACAKELIAAGADIEARDIAGYSPLFHAVSPSHNSRQSMAIAAALIAGGADVNSANRTGTNMLSSAVMGGDASAFNLLIESGADYGKANGACGIFF